MRVLRPKEVGNVPLEMFTDVRTTLAELGYPEHHYAEFEFSHGLDEEQPSARPLKPLIEVLKNDIGDQHMWLAAFSIRTATIPPESIAPMTTTVRHRDGNFTEYKARRYLTADCAYTDFGRWFPEPSPGTVVRFDRRNHQAFFNDTNLPIFRTWIRSTIYVSSVFAKKDPA